MGEGVPGSVFSINSAWLSRYDALYFTRGSFLSSASGLPLGVNLSIASMCDDSFLIGYVGCKVVRFYFVVDVVKCMLVMEKKNSYSYYSYS